MIHDRREHVRLEGRPLQAFALGDGEEVAAQIDALDAIDREQSLRERRTVSAVAISSAASIFFS